MLCNYYISNIDGSVNDIKEVLGRERLNSKGVNSMKIFGEISRVKDDECKAIPSLCLDGI